MKPKNLADLHESFGKQAGNFENKNMSFTKQEYLDDTLRSMNLKKSDLVLEVAAGTCACGRSAAPFVQKVVCLDATPAMLAVGKEEAYKSGLTNMEFVEGYVEEIPFEAERFDIVLSRLAFHHFTGIERPFSEMDRVLKHGGQLVIIDMEAAEEQLREIEDRIETMRDPSHVKNPSQAELLALYETHGYRMAKQEPTTIPVSLSAWLELTRTPAEISRGITKLMEDELHGGPSTGFRPYLQDGQLYFEQRWVLFIGERPA